MSKAETKIRLLIADDQRLVRDGIASLLGLDEEIEVVGTAENGQQAVDLARDLKPKVCLLDIRMPVMDGISALELIRKEESCPFVVMLTTFDDREYILRSLKAGAVGYLLKDLPSEELAQAVKQVVRGVFLADGKIMHKLMGSLGGEFESGQRADGDRFALSQRASLSEREREVLSLLGEGLTNGEIAESLGLSEGTVKNYISSILTSLGFRDRVQAALFACRHGGQKQ